MIARKKKLDIFRIEIISTIIFILVSIFLLIFFRQPSEKDIVLSKDLIKIISAKSTTIPKIKGIMILSADISKNKRMTIYREEFDPELKRLYNEFFATRNISNYQPLFVSNNDKINFRIVRLINHEFLCSPYSETLANKFVPESGKLVTTICSVAIPPSFGEFNGMVSVFLSSEPTDEEKSIIQVIIKQIADDVAPNFKQN